MYSVLRCRAPALGLRTRTFSSTPAARSLAKITLVGRLGADAEVATTNSGQELLRYSVATTSGPAENRATSWWRVVAFPANEERREAQLSYLKKGAMVYVEGNATMRSYENNEGKTESAVNIIQTAQRLLSPPPERGQAEGASS